jgi:hypothetical protein
MPLLLQGRLVMQGVGHRIGSCQSPENAIPVEFGEFAVAAPFQRGARATTGQGFTRAGLLRAY